MIRNIQYIIFALCSGCAIKAPSKPQTLPYDNFNAVNEAQFVQRTISGSSNIDYSQPLFIFAIICGAVFLISFFPLFLSTCNWFYKKILTLFKK